MVAILTTGGLAEFKKEKNVAAVSTNNHLDVLGKLVDLYQDVYAHDGYGEIRVEVRIQRRGQKEVILHCGKQYRYVLDFDSNTTRQMKNQFSVVNSTPWQGSMGLDQYKDDRRSGADRRVKDEQSNFKPGRRKGADRRVTATLSDKHQQKNSNRIHKGGAGPRIDSKSEMNLSALRLPRGKRARTTQHKLKEKEMLRNANKIVEQFNVLDVDQIENIKDKKMRKKALRLKRKEGGFTLLELLVVVGILAIIGGALISSFGGQETKAAQGTATNAIAGIEGAMRTYQTVNNRLPDNLEALACRPTAAATPAAADIIDGPVPDAVTVTQAYKFGGQSNVSGVGGGMGKKLADKLSLRPATTDEAAALSDAGVTKLRYAVTAGCDNDDSTVESVATIGGTTLAAAADFGAGKLVDLDIPNHAFEDPRPNSANTAWENRGRGFSVTMAAGEPVMVWDGGTGGYNNKKLGAGENDVLVAMGIGQASDFIGGPDSPFAKAPFYGQIGKDKYAHYIALVNIGTDSDADGELNSADGDTLRGEGKAYVQAVIDARGDFLDEEIAEFSGQKG